MSDIVSLIETSPRGAINKMQRIQQIIGGTRFDVLRYHDTVNGDYGPPQAFQSRRQLGVWHGIGR